MTLKTNLRIATGLLCLSASFQSWAQAPTVLNIYPSTQKIPENVLRFYIQFSQPMQEMGILQHVHLTDSEGHNLSGVFYENQYELWNNNRTKVTLIVDPGRVKTGLEAHEQMGRAFVAGQTYHLTVDNQLLNFAGEKLEKPYTKEFVGVTEDITAPRIQNWRISEPQHGTTEALYIDFKEPLDHISAQTLIKVLHHNHEVNGAVTLSQDESVWQFTPSEPWQADGTYELIVNAQLEDIASNSLDLAFEHPHKEGIRIIKDQRLPIHVR
ncbi:Ig-like domain-containing protein [Hydromonas duriensis]|uniref:SbsA Ig-like domain-containing protein n=1 Tax=Hydromonas duriensis TaxID=1527608 RepID=A0A4R6Y9L6_9BURK|nr:Ig-like domain-containing protein [Hydromonas duriensis]TDR32137.1 hypothetical protein DFR44_10520 [Hydromonas duriensis]